MCGGSPTALSDTTNITPFLDPSKCTFDLTAPAEVGKPYAGILTTRLSNGKPNNRKCQVTCHIKSLCNGVTTDCVIDREGPGRYSIQYTPTVRGRHELTVNKLPPCSRKCLSCVCHLPSYTTRQACQDLDWDKSTLWYHCQL